MAGVRELEFHTVQPQIEEEVVVSVVPAEDLGYKKKEKEKVQRTAPAPKKPAPKEPEPPAMAKKEKAKYEAAPPPPPHLPQNTPLSASTSIFYPQSICLNVSE